jgi:glucokinase
VLVNDLEANAYGIAMLELKDFVVLNQGAADASGNAAIVSAGTGLGEAGLFWDGKQHRPFACEGGHTDLAPRNELEVELLRFLLGKFSRVSYERAVSGPGLVNIYNFLRDSGRGQESPDMVEAMRQQNPAAVISKAALDGTCALSVQALDLFVSLYGAEAGNLALKIMSTGGLFVGGGIAPKILPKLTGPLFMEAFTTKGRMSPLLKAMPVRVIMNEKTALLGAARCVLDQL